MAVDDKTVYLDQTDERMGPLFAADRVGMMVTGPWQLYDFVEAKTPYGVTILPGPDGDHRRSPARTSGRRSTTRTPTVPTGPTELLKWLTSAGAWTSEWNIGLGNLPLRASEAGQPGVRRSSSRSIPGIDVFVGNLANAKHGPTDHPAVSSSCRATWGPRCPRCCRARAPRNRRSTDAAKQADQALSFG